MVDGDVIKLVKGLERKEVLPKLPLRRDYRVEFKGREQMGLDDRITIVSNAMFKTIFASDNALKYVTLILEPLLNCSYDEILKNIKHMDSALPKKSLKNKTQTSDLVVEINNLIVDIEVNSVNSHERNMEYADRLYASRVTVGGKYEYKVVMLLEINNFYHKGHNDTIETYYIESRKNTLLGLKIYVQIYIPSIRKKYYNGGKLTRLEEVIFAMTEPSLKIANKIIEGDEILKTFTKEMMSIQNDEEFMEEYDYDYQNALAMEEIGIEKGLKQGREEGATHKKIEIAQNMFDFGYKIEEISKICKISLKDLKTLLKLQRN